jgi:hypothetical protein
MFKELKTINMSKIAAVFIKRWLSQAEVKEMERN